MNEAKYQNELIEAKDYIEEKHYKNIFCPECSKAPIHLVKKQIAKPYFSSNRKDEHEEDCQYYREFISNEAILRLVESKSIKDQERLEFLINSNLDSSIRLLLKDIKTPLTNATRPIETTPNLSQSNNNKKVYQKENIPRIHIKNLNFDSEFVNQYAIIYGQAEIIVKTVEKTDPKTQDTYIEKSLSFYHGKGIKFSCFLSKNQSKYFDETKNYQNAYFAIFGQLLINEFQEKKYLNLRIKTTKELRIRTV